VDGGLRFPRKTSKHPSGSVFTGVHGRGDCATHFSFIGAFFRGTNSSASAFALQQPAPSEFGVAPLHRNR